MDRLLIRGARIVSPADGPEFTGDIRIENGRFQGIGRSLDPAGAEIVEASGLTAAPGLVDMHTHLRAPGFPEKEDILSGCRAAAAGGVTSLVCMPNTRPAADSAETVRSIREKAKRADARVYAAGAITKELGGKELCNFQELRDAGAIVLSDDGRPVEDAALMALALRRACGLGMPVLSHCEELSLSAGGKVNEGAVSGLLGVKGVPAAAEDCGTAREIALAAAYGVPVHICHVSTANSVAMVRDAKRRGVKVTAETAPHYFSLTEQELLSRDADYRMSPPLRTEADRLAVVEGLRDGTIDAIATDHAPHTPEEKSGFLTAPNGVVGMETSLAAGLTYLVKPRILSLERLISLMSPSPAAILGISAGHIREGDPADLVLFDPEERWTVDPERLHGRSRNAVFKGKELTGRVRLTVCRGKIVYRMKTE